MTPTRRLVTAVAGLAVATLALTGCLAAAIPPESSATPGATKAPVSDGAPAGFEEYYTQTLTWEGCSGADAGSYDCTQVTAPSDWSDPDAGDLSLALIRRSADSGSPMGSLLTNPGGPGASGYDLIADSASFAVAAPLLQAYDVIGFDPRGVGRSSAVACLSPADMDAYLFDIPADPRGSDGWTAELTQRNEGFVAGCEQSSDGILPYITTDNAARDMDLLRAVLGDEKLNYLGYSYGTFLGATYAKLFPDRVGRLVLDGAIDPSVSGLDVSTTQAVGFESALRAYMADCLTTSDCPFAGDVDDAMADLGTLLASVDRSPLANSDGRMLGADSLMTGIISALYSQASWQYLTVGLTDALQGNASVMFQLADFYYGRNPDGSYADNSTEAFRAYNCMDYPVDTDQADVDAADAVVAAQAPTIAPYWDGVDVCASWPYPPTGVREPIAADGAAPIVVVGTTNDPATPYTWSQSLADQLSSGVLVTRVGEGHTGYNKGNACVDDAVNAYMLDGTVPEDGLRCG
ncbi:alpha/beta hydrolase [Microbacterium telephonicum]|uniref:Alpha/beta hydrolase family protein n=1 Tax=Microbacterium telephonicum TaxID=1714841 RepID=A0A498BYI7_9MICO|nr:alpha/beta hydrolase [Microbacterium telephonicum]RLK47456.1 alpha/beta hydrolase family protein [Microbacterium telephonicum]